MNYSFKNWKYFDSWPETLDRRHFSVQSLCRIYKCTQKLRKEVQSVRVRASNLEGLIPGSRDSRSTLQSGVAHPVPVHVFILLLVTDKLTERNSWVVFVYSLLKRVKDKTSKISKRRVFFSQRGKTMQRTAEVLIRERRNCCFCVDLHVQ